MKEPQAQPVRALAPIEPAPLIRRFGALMVDWLLCLLASGLFANPRYREERRITLTRISCCESALRRYAARVSYASKNEDAFFQYAAERCARMARTFRPGEGLSAQRGSFLRNEETSSS